MTPGRTGTGARVVALALLAAASSPQQALARVEPLRLPIPIPARPFILLDAPRRVEPSEAARVRVQLRGGGRVHISVFRVHDPSALLADPARWRQGVSVASSKLGQEAERLVAAARRARLPRRGAGLTLVRQRAVRVTRVRRPKRVHDETEVYDSFEAQESVATYWVLRGRWGERTASLGRLPAGLYLVRAHRGAWAAAAYLSVGKLTLLVRRGDLHDVALVTDASGAPRARVAVEVRAGDRTIHRATTGADGMIRTPASDAPSLRFVARQRDDIAWSDVTHARLSACDPRVYLATGRPVYRPGETIYIHGHLRGCTPKGFALLAGESVRLWTGDGGLTVKTNADGNFTARVVATSDGVIRARVRGKDHVRDIQIDRRVLPRRRLMVRLDRPWAASRQLVKVTVADEAGGWPRDREVILRTPAGRLVGKIGPGRPARFQFRVPPASTLQAAAVMASITGGSRTTTATAQLWIGSKPEVLHLHADRTRGKEGDLLPVRVTAANLGGEPVAGKVQIAVSGSDGNRPKGKIRWQTSLTLVKAQAARLIPLKGSGPWWIEARRGSVTSTLVMWDRRRPPTLSARGPLAVRPRALLVRPGAPLEVDVRLPRGGGRAWVTLEQGNVWSSTMVRGAGTVRTRLAVPPRARGLAAVVVSHIARSQVRTATTTVEVETSQTIDLSLNTDKKVYPEGAKARVTLQARGAAGRPRRGVVSLWLADAGYWELGQDRYPLPNDFFALPGRMCSPGDSTRPVAFGAEEGRRLDAVMSWNGKTIPGTSFRHGWGHGGALVKVSARGKLVSVARRLALAAGLAGARVCPKAARAAGRVSLKARNLPWDLVAVKVASLTGTSASLAGRILRFDCGMGHASLGRGGGGSGAGTVGAGGLGSIGSVREQRMEGTLRFIGLRRLGPTGRLVLDLALPRHPGRWRIEAIVIAGDGGGRRAHGVVHTVRPLFVSISIPTRLRPGDVTVGEISLRGPALRGKSVALKVKLPNELEPLTTLPSKIKLDSRGAAAVRVKLRARKAGPGYLRVAASHGKIRDAVQQRIDVYPSSASRPVGLRAIVGPRSTDVRLDVPPLARPSRLRISINDDLVGSVQEVLRSLRRPRWKLSVMALDRLASLRTLSAAVDALAARPGARTARLTRLQNELSRDIKGELAALEQLRAPDGAVSWWSTLRSDTRLTAMTLYHADDAADVKPWSRGLDVIRFRTRRGRVSPAALGPAAAALAPGGAADKKLSARLLGRLLGGRPALADAVWGLRAAGRLKDSALRRSFGDLVAGKLTATIARAPRWSCGGPRWFLCFGRNGAAARAARAAVALLMAKHKGAAALAARAAAWLARRPSDPWWAWGTAEADEVALLIHLGVRSSPKAAKYTVQLGKKTVARGRAGSPANVLVERAGPLLVRFYPAVGRAVRVHVDGTLATRPPPKTVGPVGLSRRFVHDGAGWSVRVSFRLSRDSQRVEMGIPLPAGLELPGDPASRAATTTESDTRWRSWMDVGAPKLTRRPRLSAGRGALRLRWGKLSAGHHEVRIRLEAIAPGIYAAPGAWLRTARASAWGLTAPGRVTLK